MYTRSFCYNDACRDVLRMYLCNKNIMCPSVSLVWGGVSEDFIGARQHKHGCNRGVSPLCGNLPHTGVDCRNALPVPSQPRSVHLSSNGLGEACYHSDAATLLALRAESFSLAVPAVWWIGSTNLYHHNEDLASILSITSKASVSRLMAALTWWLCSWTRLYPPQRLWHRQEAATAALMLPDIQRTGTSGWGPFWGKTHTPGGNIP